ncbi:RNA-binding protein [Archaeoglobales archaeon ex4484_92]|nr:MAG: RNA-binding protein [Archaeoglobales archaeon ex4484_92]
MEVGRCVSCGAVLVGANYVEFPCPICGETIYRCKKCRRLANPYVCTNCGFIGP